MGVVILVRDVHQATALHHYAGLHGGGRSSLLFRTAPRRVLHIGEPTEVGNYGTPLSVLEQRARIKELFAETGQIAELRDDPEESDLGRWDFRDRE